MKCPLISTHTSTRVSFNNNIKQNLSVLIQDKAITKRMNIPRQLPVKTTYRGRRQQICMRNISMKVRLSNVNANLRETKVLLVHVADEPYFKMIPCM